MTTKNVLSSAAAFIHGGTLMTTQAAERLSITIDEARKLATKKKRGKLQDAFMAHWRLLAPQCGDLPEPVAEHRFHPVRMWRFDFCWPQIRLAVELNGGGFVGGRHNRGGGASKDYDKLNAAQRLGWVVLQFGTEHMHDPASVVLDVLHAIAERPAVLTPND
jgi:very-short-patch-repair endonuclease